MASDVIDNSARRRFELDSSGGKAFIDYRRDGEVLLLTHAEVPAQSQGRGTGSALVRGTLLLVRERGERVIPRCSFVAAYIARHPEFHDLLASPPSGH